MRLWEIPQPYPCDINVMRKEETICFIKLNIKKERIRKRIYKTRDLARADIFDYIEVFYNRARRHSHLGGVSPEAFEQASS